MDNPDLTWMPSGDRLLVRPCIAADRTRSGLYLPEATRELPSKGLVLAVGPGARSELSPTPIPNLHEVGDLVAFGKYAGLPIRLENGEDLLLLRDTEALARKPAGTFTLVEHEVPAGLSTMPVLHLTGETCAHCPPRLPREPSEIIAAERNRLRREKAAR
jgi:chaperonin GroES